jgi:hypothetical protein
VTIDDLLIMTDALRQTAADDPVTTGVRYRMKIDVCLILKINACLVS